MARWLVRFVPEAEIDLQELDVAVRRSVVQKLDWLQENFDKIKPVALVGERGGFFKLRAGDYRVIYKIDYPQEFLVIIQIGHRSKIYKKK